MQQMDDKKLAKHPDIFWEQMKTDYYQKTIKPFSYYLNMKSKS